MSKTNQRIRIYSALEVANICGVVNQTAINWIRQGHLNAFTTPGGQYRVYEEDLSDFLTKRGMRNSINARSNLDEDSNADAQNSYSEIVLIIDNNRDANDRLSAWLKMVFPGFTVLQAYDGFEAGQQLYQARPGLVFLNVDLPGINVFSLAKKFKEDGSLGNPNVIALGDNDAAGALQAAWSDAYFSRPLDLEKLQETIRDIEKQTRALVTA
jgi:excisionase family DNA binding protein